MKANLADMEKALFLDRDGVINIDFGYVHRREDFVFVPKIFDFVRLANTKGYRVIVVTNQGGIGLGYYEQRDFWKLTNWMLAEFEKNDAKIDKVYCAPGHPRGNYTSNNLKLRKPQPGMLLIARDEFNLDMKRSIMVGDNITDIQAATAAGIDMKILLKPRNYWSMQADYIQVSSLTEAYEYLSKRNE